MTRAISFGLRSSRAAVIAILIGMSAALGGCMHATAQDDTTASIPSDYRQRHPIAIQEADHSIVVLVGTARGGLTASQRVDVAGYAQSWLQEATGGIVIALPTRTPNERAATQSLHEIRAMLTAAGVPAHGVSVHPYTPSNPRQLPAIKLSYPKVIADAGPCGLWPEDLGPTFKNPIYQNNRPYWNLGCAYQRNMAAMVANPSDLVQPRSETPRYSERRQTVLEKYRKGETPSMPTPAEADKSKLSDVGK